MSRFKRFLSRLGDLQMSLDDALVASALAQAGEPRLARQHVLDCRRNRNCCDALDHGRRCLRVPAAQCVPAYRKAS